MHFSLFLRYFFTKEKADVHRKIDESASFFAQVIKPMTYSDSS
jgi:hypothetical protein